MGFMRVYQNKAVARIIPFIIVSLSTILLVWTVNVYSSIVLPNKLQDFATLSLSIFIEAFPFLVLGSLLAAVVNTYVSHERIHTILPNNATLRRFMLSLLGFIFPVCECGNVPLSRALMIQGLKPSESITFLLAAPVINPITIWATMTAFQFDHSIVFSRVIATFLIANFIGYVLSRTKNEKMFLSEDFARICSAEQKHASHTHDAKRIGKLSRLFSNEAYLMLKMLAFGAIIAGIIQTFIPRELIITIGSNVVLSILVMLLLAFIISICANVDAFFALSFAGTFTAGSIVSFLVFGPMIDIKMLVLLKTTFKAKLLIIVSVLSLLLSALTGVIVTYAL